MTAAEGIEKFFRGAGTLWNHLTGATERREEDQAFQEKLAKNQYQWSAESMKNAGLNPYMMYSGGAGASVPGAAGVGEGTGGNPIGAGGNLLGGVAQIINSTRTLNSKNEQAFKASVFDKVLKMLNSAEKTKK